MTALAGEAGRGASRLALLAFAPLIAAALAWSAARGALSVWGWVGHLAAGLLLWTLLEYVVHRFVFHVVPATPWLLERQQHLHHHREPGVADYCVVPLWFSIPVALAVWGLLRLAAGSWDRAGLMCGGVMLGYVAYELIHYEIHVGRRRGRLLRFWRRHHFYHHYRDPNRCWGFTTPLWDIVFRTGPVRRRVP